MRLGDYIKNKEGIHWNQKVQDEKEWKNKGKSIFNSEQIKGLFTVDWKENMEVTPDEMGRRPKNERRNTLERYITKSNWIKKNREIL